MPSGKIVNFPQSCPIASVGPVYKITEHNIDLQNIEFANETIGNYYFTVNYINGICLHCVYSSARKANIDRNYIIKWLKKIMLIEYKDRDIIVLPNVTRIENSFQIRSIKEMKDIINSAKIISKRHYKRYRGYAIHIRTMFGMICEWRAHNLLWALGVKRECTKHVDLELKVKWYYKIGYFVLSCCYLRW